MSDIRDKIKELVNEFHLSDDSLRNCVDYFIEQTKAGLAKTTERGLPMIPTFVTSVPDGSEKGTFLAVDLGGTNFRVCSVKLNGDSTYELIQEKAPIPHELMVGNSYQFFDYLALQVEKFLKFHHSDKFYREPSSDPRTPEVFKMGFTFSFPVDQTGLNRGKLIRWTKGFDIKDAVGKDIVGLLQSHLNMRGLPVHVAALVNDTVGTLMSRSYTKPNGGRTLIGCIFGTGTNGAYSEKIKSIPKFNAAGHPEITDKIMVINTEWGSFDNDLVSTPDNRFDKQVNQNTPNKGFHMFEKRISGMFLGELLRLVLVELQVEGYLFAETDELISDKLRKDALNKPWSIDTSVCSKVDADPTSDLTEVEAIVQSFFGYKTNLEQRQAIQTVAKAIGRRSAYLSAIPIAGIVIHTKGLEKFDTIDIGADGSVVEFYPGFESMVREALRKTKIGEDEKRITLGIAKDGSGVGAALCALVA
jgi:hexokinase